MEIILTVFSGIIIIGFLLGFSILMKPSFKSNTNKYLGFTVLTICMLLVKLILPEFDYFRTHQKLNIICNIEWILLAPVFLFLFSIKSIDNKLSSYKELKLLYLPFIFSLLLNTIDCLERDFRLFTFKSAAILRLRHNLFMFESKLIYIYIAFLMLWLFFILKNSPSKQANKAIRNLHLVLSLIIIFWIMVDFIRGIFPHEINKYYGLVLLIAGSFSLFWISYTIIYKHKMLHQVSEINKILRNQEASVANTEPSVSTQTIFEKFEALFKEEHIYRNPNITRESVAQQLDISAGYLSQVITTNSDDNFSSIINQYRITEVKKMLCDATFDKYSIEAIGLEAGYSSKTTFYKAFKNSTNMTPKTYKEKYG